MAPSISMTDLLDLPGQLLYAVYQGIEGPVFIKFNKDQSHRNGQDHTGQSPEPISQEQENRVVRGGSPMLSPTILGWMICRTAWDRT